LGFGILTAVVGAVMALAQRHLKRMLAFVTMSHLGIYLIGVGLLTPLGLTGASLLVIGDGLAKSALFLGVGVLQHQRASVSETKLRGRGRGLAATGVTLALGALVLADLPPFVSASGHALLVEAADQAGLPWMEIVIALCVIASSAAVLRAAARIWLGWGGAESPDTGSGTADDPGEESEDRSDTAGAGRAQDRPERAGAEPPRAADDGAAAAGPARARVRPRADARHRGTCRSGRGQLFGPGGLRRGRAGHAPRVCFHGQPDRCPGLP